VTAANRLSKLRGPDKTAVQYYTDRWNKELMFLHNLLDISGHSISQPVVATYHNQRMVAVFNGEIYNYKHFGDYLSDSECLIPIFRLHGRACSSHFDGEFAALIYDGRTNQAHIYTDPFLTKPLYLGRSEDPSHFGAATYASSLRSLGFTRIEMAEPNSRYDVAFGETQVHLMHNREVFKFCISQTKNTYDDWCDAFLEAVKKRALHGAYPPVVFMSSGYDSGAVCLALNLMNIKYETFSIMAGESKAILRRRMACNLKHACTQAHSLPGLTQKELEHIVKDIAEFVEPFTYVHQDASGHYSDLQSDGGAIGASRLAQMSHSKSQRVNLSCTGADEIISDYGFAGRKFCHHSEFGGHFPEDLSSIFPWKKFYRDTQRSYLFKDEYILGRNGIEGRYPFLDKCLVQEFLSLSAELKNRTYKAPIDYFLRKWNYPYERLTKRGFSPGLP
jgi:asparagine synthetase B (glutamine-hydrolysing)